MRSTPPWSVADEMAHELHAPWSCTSTTPGVHVERHELEVAPVGLDGGTHQLDQRPEVGLTLGADLVAHPDRACPGRGGVGLALVRSSKAGVAGVGHPSIVP